MNYKVSEKNKKIIVIGALTDIEQSLLEVYIKSGYKVTVKEKKKSNRISEKDIIRWFSIKDDKEGLEKFKNEKEKKIKDKNGNDRKAGYLKAVKWFKETYPNAIEEIKEMKKKK